MVNSKTIAPTNADKAKSEYHKFITRTVKKRNLGFLNVGKKVQQLFFKVFKILLILSHEQAQAECGFSTVVKLLVENQNTESLIVQRIIHDHVRFHKHQPHTINITTKLQNHVKQARR